MKKTTLLFSIAALVAGCSTAIIRSKVEKGIRDRLPQYLGEAESYKVSVKGPESDLIGGKIQSLHIEGTKAQLNGVIVDKMTVDMNDIRFDPINRTAKSVGETYFVANISSESINSYIQQHRDNTDSISIEIKDGHVLVNAIPKFAGVNFPITIKGKPTIVNGSKVEFKADSAAISVLPVPAFIVNAIIDRVNPVFDASQIRIPITIDNITIEDGFVVISGKAIVDLNALPN